MRTGVLKDKQVGKTLNEKFVCSWKNIEGESTCGSSYAHEPTDKPGVCSPGDGEHNTQICVFTSDGRLLDVMAGYQSPEFLKSQLEWVWKNLLPIATNEKIADDVKKQMLQRQITALSGATKCHEAQIDLKYVHNHVLDPWTKFSITELVDGRGFGDHFFGRAGDKSTPGEGIGEVPAHMKRSIESGRMSEINSEALVLKRQYGLSNEKSRRDIMEKLRGLETEYATLKAKSLNANQAVGVKVREVPESK